MMKLMQTHSVAKKTELRDLAAKLKLQMDAQIEQATILQACGHNHFSLGKVSRGCFPPALEAAVEDRSTQRAGTSFAAWKKPRRWPIKTVANATNLLGATARRHLRGRRAGSPFFSTAAIWPFSTWQTFLRLSSRFFTHYWLVAAP